MFSYSTFQLANRITLCLLTLSTTLMGTGCGGFEVVNAEEKAALDLIRTGTYQLIPTEEISRLRADAALGKSSGRYQQFSRGFRTFRLDTATGESCILLTSENDWKKPETIAQSCGQADLMKDAR